MSSKVDVTGIKAELFEAFVMKAASKSFAKTFATNVNVSRIVKGGVQFYESANDLQISAFGSQEVHSVNPYASNSPSAALTISQVASSVESLPIVDAKGMISLHFTPPTQEVVTAGSEVFDIETLENADLSYDLKIKIAQTSKISISYDIVKVDDMDAAKFMDKLKMYLDDPDMMLL